MGGWVGGGMGGRMVWVGGWVEGWYGWVDGWRDGFKGWFHDDDDAFYLFLQKQKIVNINDMYNNDVGKGVVFKYIPMKLMK
jgi:hypothetical protein